MPTNLTNLFGTITAALAFLYGLLEKLGCTPGATDLAATCNIPWLPVAWVPWIAMAFGILTIVMKLTRPGGVLGSLFGSTAVVSPTPGVGTVTPEQVKTP